MDNRYRICARCVMDTTDPDITFDENGICNHCKRYDELTNKFVYNGDEGRHKLNNIIHNIKKDGANMHYDCIIGLSGGVDSTYTAYLVKKLGLRPLAVHLDNGWDSELAVKNIENIVKRLNYDLYTYVIDWEEFKDLQLSFLKASTPDSEVPTDHAILSILPQMAKKNGINYVINGANHRTETHLPNAWSAGHIDWRYIKSVHKKFGKKKLKTFPHMSIWQLRHYYKTLRRIDILNYVEYIKKDSMKIIESELGWKSYGGKHYESIYTRFYQGYILPRKFGFDKRKSHLSSLICSGEISREEALKELENEPYPIELQNEDKEYVIKKFCLTENEFERIMNLPKKSYREYPSNTKIYNNFLYKIISKIYRSLTISSKHKVIHEK